MKKGKRNGFLGILVTLLVFAMMLIGCKEEESTDTGFKSTIVDSYSSGNTFTLTMNKIPPVMYQELVGTDYVLIIKMTDETEKISRGIIESGVIGGLNLNFQLQPSVEDSIAFNVILTIDKNDKWNISSINGEIAVEEGDTVYATYWSTSSTSVTPDKTTNTKQPKSFMEKVKTFFTVAAVIFIGLLILAFWPKGKGNYASIQLNRDGTYTYTSADGTKFLQDGNGNRRMMSHEEAALRDIANKL